MRSHKIVLIKLHQFSTYFGVKNRAADTAADVPPTCRRHAAAVAADAAADAVPSERPESVFSDPIHMIAYPRNIAPQKRSWRFSTKAAGKLKLRKNLLNIDRRSTARFSLVEDIPGDFRSDHRRIYTHIGNRSLTLVLRNGLDLGTISGQVVDALLERERDNPQSAVIQITITRIVRNAPAGVMSLSALLNAAYRRTP